MKNRASLFGLGLVVAGLVLPAGFAAPTSAKEATVTLEISGMT
jgi:hypothetical protein